MESTALQRPSRWTINSNKLCIGERVAYQNFAGVVVTSVNDDGTYDISFPTYPASIGKRKGIPRIFLKSLKNVHQPDRHTSKKFQQILRRRNASLGDKETHRPDLRTVLDSATTHVRSSSGTNIRARSTRRPRSPRHRRSITRGSSHPRRPRRSSSRRILLSSSPRSGSRRRRSRSRRRSTRKRSSGRTRRNISRSDSRSATRKRRKTLEHHSREKSTSRVDIELDTQDTEEVTTNGHTKFPRSASIYPTVNSEPQSDDGDEFSYTLIEQRGHTAVYRDFDGTTNTMSWKDWLQLQALLG